MLLFVASLDFFGVFQLILSCNHLFRFVNVSPLDSQLFLGVVLGGVHGVV